MQKKTGSEILKREGGESLAVQTQHILHGRSAVGSTCSLKLNTEETSPDLTADIKTNYKIIICNLIWSGLFLCHVNDRQQDESSSHVVL